MGVAGEGAGEGEGGGGGAGGEGGGGVCGGFGDERFLGGRSEFGGRGRGRDCFLPAVFRLDNSAVSDGGLVFAVSAGDAGPVVRAGPDGLELRFDRRFHLCVHAGPAFVPLQRFALVMRQPVVPRRVAVVGPEAAGEAAVGEDGEVDRGGRVGGVVGEVCVGGG